MLCVTMADHAMGMSEIEDILNADIVDKTILLTSSLKRHLHK